MGLIGVSIVKSTSFRGVAQEFSNTYYYDVVGTPNATVAQEIIDALVTKEKAKHSTTISFVRAKAWTAGGTNQQNNMLVQTNLTGAGSATDLAQMDKERAVLVRFRAGQDSRGRPVYLRKWWHLNVTAIGGSSLTNGQLANTSGLDSTQKAAIVAFGDDIKNLTLITNGFTNATLVSPKGRPITGATTAHPYLEHHQLGDMWR